MLANAFMVPESAPIRQVKVSDTPPCDEVIHATQPNAESGISTLREYREKTRTPVELITDPTAEPEALAIFLKTGALGKRPEGCNAKMVTLAGNIRATKRGSERGAATLTERKMYATTRRTKTGGTGESAIREAIVPNRSPAIWLRVAPVGNLTPREVKVWARVMLANQRGENITPAMIAKIIPHRTGAKAGQPVSDQTAAAVLRVIERAGYLDIEEGAAGRNAHRYYARDTHVRAVPDPVDNPQTPQANPLESDASGPLESDASLVMKEDSSTALSSDSARGDAVRSQTQVVATVAEPETDGQQSPDEIEHQEQPQQPAPVPKLKITPGVRLLVAIGRDFPRYRLTGAPLQHQALIVDGLLTEGWTAAQITERITARLPNRITKSVAALISRRLRDAATEPVPASLPAAPGRTYTNQHQEQPHTAPTPTADAYDPASRYDSGRWHECEGREGTCGRTVAAAGDLCPHCQGTAWELTPGVRTSTDPEDPAEREARAVILAACGITSDPSATDAEHLIGLTAADTDPGSDWLTATRTA